MSRGTCLAYPRLPVLCRTYVLYVHRTQHKDDSVGVCLKCVRKISPLCYSICGGDRLSKKTKTLLFEIKYIICISERLKHLVNA